MFRTGRLWRNLKLLRLEQDQVSGRRIFKGRCQPFVQRLGCGGMWLSLYAKSIWLTIWLDSLVYVGIYDGHTLFVRQIPGKLAGHCLADFAWPDN